MNAAQKRLAHGQTIANDPRWKAVIERDSSQDGTFVYSVSTTGVYCRPSCPSRKPRPEHVQFHRSTADARAAGFRPCQRCYPDQPQRQQPQVDLIAEICRRIERAEFGLSLDELAAQAGLSKYHFHRLFKEVTGLTPRQYAAAHRQKRVREQLNKSARVTDALLDAGYNSTGRFYETANDLIGMTPSAYRQGGLDSEIRFAVGECSLGAILVAQSHRGICAISLGEDADQLARDLQDQFPRAQLLGGDPAFEQLVAQVVGFVEAPAIGLSLPLDIRGTAFQQRVWQALRDIPAGETASYVEIAERIGAPKSYRAVAQACAANKLAVAIPCHRVVRQDGDLSGYRWGVERKRSLLHREASHGSDE